MVHAAWKFIMSSSDPVPVEPDTRQPYVQQDMMVPFTHEGRDYPHKLDLTHRVDEQGRPWIGRSSEDKAAAKASAEKTPAGT